MDIFILGLVIVAVLIIIGFFVIRSIIRERENQKVTLEEQMKWQEQQQLKQKINNIQDKISNLENQKQEILNPIIHSTTSYFHYELNRQVPLDNWELIPGNYDTAQSFKIKNATYKMVQKEFYNVANYESLEDFIENIAYKCLRKNLTTTKTVHKTRTQHTEGKYIKHKGNTTFGGIFTSNGVMPVVTNQGSSSTYIPGSVVTNHYEETAPETLQDIIYRVYHYYRMNVENVSEYLVEEVYETLKEAFPKASDIDLWHSLFDHSKFFKIYHLEDELCKRYLERHSNVDFDGEICKLQKQLEFYKSELRLK